MGDYVLAGIELVGGIAAFLIIWGASRSSIKEHERRIDKQDGEIKELYERIGSLNDVYVSYRHFNEIMGSIKETQKELKDDMKRVIELLSNRS